MKSILSAKCCLISLIEALNAYNDSQEDSGKNMCGEKSDALFDKHDMYSALSKLMYIFQVRQTSSRKLIMIRWSVYKLAHKVLLAASQLNLTRANHTAALL